MTTLDTCIAIYLGIGLLLFIHKLKGKEDKMKELMSKAPPAPDWVLALVAAIGICIAMAMWCFFWPYKLGKLAIKKR